MVRPSHELSNVVVGGIRDYAEALEKECGHEVDPEDAHEKLLRRALVDVGVLPPGCTSDDDTNTNMNTNTNNGGDTV